VRAVRRSRTGTPIRYFPSLGISASGYQDEISDELRRHYAIKSWRIFSPSSCTVVHRRAPLCRRTPRDDRLRLSHVIVARIDEEGLSSPSYHSPAFNPVLFF